MGEHIYWKGDSYKLGTCEDLYYVTYDDLLAMVNGGARKLGGNLAPHEYLVNGFRYRFPFPNEDGQDKLELPDFDRGVVTTAPAEAMSEEHESIYLALGPRGGGYNINAKVTCPMSPDAKPENYSQGPHTKIVEVCQQKAVDGHLWVVLRCPYCGTKWRLGPEEAAILVAYMRDHYSKTYWQDSWSSQRDYYLEIANRIEAGYNREV